MESSPQSDGGAKVAAAPRGGRCSQAGLGPEQVTGEPDTKVAGDQITAWASATPDDADEWLEVEFAAATKIESVQIHETYNPGAVHKVTGYDDKGKEVDLWEGKDPTDPKEEMGVSEIPLKGKLTTKRLRIYLKSKEVPGWNEIDAVGIKDAAGKQQWATKATASSTYGAGFGGFAFGRLRRTSRDPSSCRPSRAFARQRSRVPSRASVSPIRATPDRQAGKGIGRREEVAGRDSQAPGKRQIAS